MACDRTVAETIETLTVRLQTSTLLEDRRDACRGLRSLAKDYRVEVGAQAMEPLLQTIRNDRHDIEMTKYCLDSLNYIISGPLADSPAATWHDLELTSGGDLQAHGTNSTQAIQANSKTTGGDPGRELSEIFLKRTENVATIIDTTQDNDEIRWVVVRILCGLARHNLEMTQDAILSDPLNLSRLPQLVSDQRDLIKLDSLALFVRLTQNNQNIQNVLGYDDFFAKILHIIEIDEKYLDGTMAVVNDCLNILLNMTQYNEANQMLFREYGHIPKLTPFFESIQTISWTFERTACIVLVLQLVDSMVSPSNSAENVRRCQEIMHKCGILDKLCELLTASSMPIGVLSETMNTASDIVKGHLGPNASTVMQTSSMMPIILLGMVKEMCQDQEKRISELYNYMHVLHDFVSSSKSK